MLAASVLILAIVMNGVLVFASADLMCKKWVFKVLHVYIMDAITGLLCVIVLLIYWLGAFSELEKQSTYHVKLSVSFYCVAIVFTCFMFAPVNYIRSEKGKKNK